MFERPLRAERPPRTARTRRWSKHGRSQRPVLLAGAVLGLLAAACSSTAAAGHARAVSAGKFPTSIAAANGVVRITSRPRAIVSLSPTATEMLFAIGAGSQVKAVDKDSDYPPRAPHSALDGFQPNVEAIVAHRPDLVVMASDSSGLTGRLRTFGIPVLSLPAVSDLAGTYDQLEQLGAATGHVAAAAAEVATMKARIGAIVHSVGASHGVRTYYYELDPTYFSVTSSTFVGRVLSLVGLRNIADSAPSAASSGGYPQLSSEFIVHANPDFVFLADSICCAQTLHTVTARPGWSTVTAVRTGQIVVIDDAIASRWGPRIVDLLRTVATALDKHHSGP